MIQRKEKEGKVKWGKMRAGRVTHHQSKRERKGKGRDGVNGTKHLIIYTLSEMNCWEAMGSMVAVRKSQDVRGGLRKGGRPKRQKT